MRRAFLLPIVVVTVFSLVFCMDSAHTAINHDVTNGAVSTLASVVTSASSTLGMAAGQGARFSSSTTNLIRVVIFSASCSQPSSCSDSNKEFLDIQYLSPDVFTIISRAVYVYEGGLTTPPASWPIGSKIQGPVSAGVLKEYKDLINKAIDSTLPVASWSADQFKATRQSGIAGESCLYDAGTGDTIACFGGPAAGGSSYKLILPNGQPAQYAFGVYSAPSGTSSTLVWNYLSNEFTLSGTTWSLNYPNIRTASSTTTGLLTSSDWSMLNAKQNRVTGFCTPGTNTFITSINVDGTVGCVAALGGGSAGFIDGGSASVSGPSTIDGGSSQ